MIRFVFFILLSLVLMLVMTGCIVPIPHTQTARTEYEGWVTDAATGEPISNAVVRVLYEEIGEFTVCTDSQGHCKIPRVVSWHFAVLIGIPMSYSLFPTFPGTSFPERIVVTANDYKSWEWHAWITKNELYEGKSSCADVDFSRIRLLRNYSAVPSCNGMCTECLGLE